MMKRMLFVVLAIGIISFALAPNVFAGKPKVPKEACYTLNSFDGPWALEGETLVLASKPSGMKVKIGSGVKKFYALNGTLSETGEYWNVTGSGVLFPDTGEEGPFFDGDFSGKLLERTIQCSYFHYEEFGAVLHCTMLMPDGSVEIQGYGTAEIVCKDIESMN